MPTNQTHKLTTIADLMRVVTADNLPGLVKDLTGLLINAALTRTIYEVAHPGEPIDIFDGVSIDWCDDGVNEQRITAGNIEFLTKGNDLK